MMLMEAARISETSVDNYFTRQYIPEDNSELHCCYVVLLQLSYMFATLIIFRGFIKSVHVIILIIIIQISC
jgi:hypothetical protein